MVSVVVLVSFVAIMAAGFAHRRFGPRRATLALFVVVVVLAGSASIAAATLRATACPCG
jgi:hypothetical protein